MRKLVALFAVLAALDAARSSGAPCKLIECPEGNIETVVSAGRVSEAGGEFTVAFRFKAAHYVKREGPWEGLVFANGNGWNNGFRATITPEVNTSLDGFRMGLRVVKDGGGATSVPVKGVLRAEHWYHLAFVLGGGELKSYLNGSLNAKCGFTGRFKRASGGFCVGPAGFGVGYYPFAAGDFMVWERALGDDEILALVTGGETSDKSVKAFLEGLGTEAFSDMRSLAWNTAKRLADAGERTPAAELYALLAERAPVDATVDGGNEIAAHFAKMLGGDAVAPAVRHPAIVPFAGYGL